MSGIAFRNSLRKLAHTIRGIPDQLGWRPYTVSIETRSWDGGERGEGAETVTTTAITEANGHPPKVRFLTSEEIALGGYSQGTLEIGPITPDFGSGGTSLDTLAPLSPSDDTIVHYIITGPEFPNGARFRKADVETHRAGHYLLRVNRAGDPS
jgi:hypothetical protein